ncbi:hypothetical protein KE530_04295 [Clostridiaceae bacterium Marseille-Q4145]|nr:hypothetical protein [Clostridiaceae bacterium Marseille-Q4145]
MKPVTKGVVVCCPKCGTVASVIRIGIGQYVCKSCKTKFTCWVVNGFSVTFEDDGDKNYLTKFEACKTQLKKLMNLNN